jgi:nucleotide-binding universal stress UspA family protein
MFTKILVATDLDKASKDAVAAAAQLARDHDASLYIVYVVLNPITQPWAAEAYGIDFPRLLEDLRRRADAQLKGIATTAALLRG